MGMVIFGLGVMFELRLGMRNWFNLYLDAYVDLRFRIRFDIGYSFRDLELD